MTIDIDKARPLSHWLRGTLILHFGEGAVVERKMHLDEARRIEAVLGETRESDALDWHSLAWFQFTGSKVVFSSFLVAEDGGWPMNPDERDAVAKVGHPHGVLRSLVDYWTDKAVPEPEYSLYAIYELHRAAVAGMSRQGWESLARLTVGSKGARWLADSTHAPKVDPDDAAEPEAPGSDHVNIADPEGDEAPSANDPSPDDAEEGGADEAGAE